MNPNEQLPPTPQQPDTIQSSNISPTPQQFPAQQITPQQQFPVDSHPPKRRISRKIALVVVALLFIIVGLGAIVWTTQSDELTSKQEDKAEASQAAGIDSTATSDKEGIQQAVNQYCVDLGNAYGFRDMNSGYIISERFSEEELSDSPHLLRFKQVGNAASATVDCEDSEGPNGISNDLLFVKENAAWSYVDEEQNYAGSGFLCSVVDMYNVPKELVSSCALSEGEAPVDR